MYLWKIQVGCFTRTLQFDLKITMKNRDYARYGLSISNKTQ